MRPFRLLVSLCCCFVFNASPVLSAIILDGSFEDQAIAQNLPHYQVVNGEKWGRARFGGWNAPGLESSWRAVSGTNTVWTGGSIARTEDFAAGWKWAKAGAVFGIIQGNQTMSQKFTAATSGEGTLTWYDANRAAWRDIDWFGRPNTYSVTLLNDSTGTIQTGGTFNSEVFGGNSYSTPVGDGWWTPEGKKGWYTRSASGFNLQAGMSYTLSFNSLAYYVDNNGVKQVDDRSTFLDDISLNLTSTIVPEPSTMAIFGLGSIGLAYLRRRRQLR